MKETCAICGDPIFMDEEVAEVGGRCFHADCYYGGEFE